MVLTALVAAKSLQSSDNIIMSMGIVIDPQNLDFFDVFRTYVVDVGMIFLTPLLIQNASYVKRLEKENIEQYNNFLITNMNLQDYYYTVIGITVVLSSVSTLFIPSAICAVILMLNLGILFMWSFKCLLVFHKPIGYIYNFIFYITFITF